ncbi:hypothetical protein L596_014844 [Steinernema carpocapsae]|uniref:PDZ domain-containing protein n=1 Tax=Steinernema carpocapsae TaxID=34508 RepID=A0A4U5NEB3_STECR|nr:hypothetical protein L596_014844 [Steinernema carpocapsae]
MRFFCIPLFACQRRVESLDYGASNLEEVPEGIERHAAHLRELFLDTNEIKELPKSIFLCKKLERLTLQGNRLTMVPPEIGDLKYLVELNLEGNDIMDLPESLGKCSFLSILALSRNMTITTFPAAITELRTLTELSLNNTNLTELPKQIENLVNLEFLELRENELRDDSIPATIKNLKSLRHFDLGENKLTFLPDEVGELSELRVLIVDENEIRRIPDEVTFCKHLEELDASKNQISVLPDAIGDLTELSELRLGSNQLESLPNSIGRLKKLTILNVEENELEGLNQAIGGCIQLNDLYANSNKITSLPSTIGHLVNLKNLHIDNNRLQDLPSVIGYCKSLSVLSLRSNGITSIPMEIGKLESLTVLDLCGNRLQHLPFTITVPSKLRALWLSLSQTQPKMTLTEAKDPVTHIRVYTCVLLPQTDSNGDEISRCSGVGPRVQFDSSDFEDEPGPSGRLVRRGTPHKKVKKDVAKKEEEPLKVMEFKEPAKSILKTRKKVESEASDEDVDVQMESLREEDLMVEDLNCEEAAYEQPTEQATSLQQGEGLLDENADYGISIMESKNSCVRVDIAVERGNDGEIGWSIMGGSESPPVKNNDTGIYVTKVVTDGPAFKAGIRQGDRLVSVNGNSLEGITHGQAVDLLQVPEDVMLFVVLRDYESVMLDEIEVEEVTVESTNSVRTSFMRPETVCYVNIETSVYEPEQPIKIETFKALAASLEEIPPRAVSSPLPSLLPSPPEHSAKRVPPPVAPKPSKDVVRIHPLNSNHKLFSD